MKKTSIGLLTSLASAAAAAQGLVNFDSDAPGGLPVGWTCGVTGSEIGRASCRERV